MKNEYNLRESNIELLRIIAMIIIVAHHFSVHGGFDFAGSTLNINMLWVQFIQMGGKIGVDIFVLISGYFLINASSFKLFKALKLWLQILTWSLLIFFVFIALGLETFDKTELIKHFLPISFAKWWFATSYFMLFLISPFLNKMLHALNKASYIKLLLLGLVCWCLIPTFLQRPLESNNLIWFIYLYMFAGFLRLHAGNIKISGKVSILISLGIVFLTFLSVVLIDLYLNNATEPKIWPTYFYGMNMLPILLISLFAVIGFSKIHIGYNRFINLIASATFGVYLIHDNNWVRPFLWEKVFKQAALQDSHYLILYSIIVIAVVFIVCTCAELLRIYLIEKRYIKGLESVSGRTQAGVNRFFSRWN